MLRELAIWLAWGITTTAKDCSILSYANILHKAICDSLNFYQTVCLASTHHTL